MAAATSEIEHLRGEEWVMLASRILRLPSPTSMASSIRMSDSHALIFKALTTALAVNAKPEWMFAATRIALATLPIPNVEGGEAKQKEQEEKEEEDDDIWESLKKIFRKLMTEDRKMHGRDDVE